MVVGKTGRMKMSCDRFAFDSVAAVHHGRILPFVQKLDAANAISIERESLKKEKSILCLTSC